MLAFVLGLLVGGGRGFPWRAVLEVPWGDEDEEFIELETTLS
jgi:hypothetical protein